MSTVPNQRKIIIHREKCERDFLQIKKENWYSANKILSPYGLQLYLYLAGNKDGFTLELSQEAAERDAGIKKTTFHTYIHTLINKGYLVPRGENSNIYDFYEIPKVIDNGNAFPQNERISLQDECDILIFDSDNELFNLSDEFENSQGSLNSPQSSKEIYNKVDNSIDKIYTNEKFVF